MSKAKAIMIQGTASGVGKSLITAALLRILKNRGLRAAPFKAQNMSNNSYVAREGGEIARAQAVQAECAGVEPSVHMSPILLKPESNLGCQVVVQGKAVGRMTAREYHGYQKQAFRKVSESFSVLSGQYDVIVIEGAGSPAEVNLRDFDLANMKMARLADAPVLLVGDIEPGGVFASLYGTFRLLRPAERRRVKGFIVNKFRGDPSLLDAGLRFLKKATGVPVLGVIPYLEGLLLDEEDSFVRSRNRETQGLDVAVYRFPRISNLTDFQALETEAGVTLRYFVHREDFGDPDLLILPGTKSTMDDLLFLRKQGVESLVHRYVKRGGRVLGICGGFQMLGRAIKDEDHAETGKRSVKGLGILPLRTVFGRDKVTKRVARRLRFQVGETWVGGMVRGYEIHMGRTYGLNGDCDHSAWFTRGSVHGTYLHGIFDNDSFRRSFLEAIGQARHSGSRSGAGNRRFFEDASSYRSKREMTFRRIADAVKKALQWNLLKSFLNGGNGKPAPKRLSLC